MSITEFLTDNGFKHNEGDNSYSLHVTEKINLEVQSNALYIIMSENGPASEAAIISERVCWITSDTESIAKSFITSFKESFNEVSGN